MAFNDQPQRARGIRSVPKGQITTCSPRFKEKEQRPHLLMGLSHVKIARKKTSVCQTGSSWGHRDKQGTFSLFKEFPIYKETKADISKIDLIMTL